tara:strand:+ start:262 stop:480 length:219 start_codon:yes stop_codon:yes gene_type:complete
MDIIKNKKNNILLSLSVTELNIIAQNLSMQIYDLEDLPEDTETDTEKTKNICIDILAQLQELKIWGKLPQKK